MVTTKDATTVLLHAVCGTIPAPVRIEEVRSRRWSSDTFVGSRHELTFRTDEDAADRFKHGLDVRNFALGNHLLADVAIASDERSHGTALLRIEALTIEEA